MTFQNFLDVFSRLLRWNELFCYSYFITVSAVGDEHVFISNLSRKSTHLSTYNTIPVDRSRHDEYFLAYLLVPGMYVVKHFSMPKVNRKENLEHGLMSRESERETI